MWWPSNNRYPVTATMLWLRDLKDTNGRNRILARIDRLRFGNPGDAKSVGGA
jgi:putative component of toxin-antitoxin plasmid stabilization module